MKELFEDTTPILTSDQKVRVFISSTIEELKEERKAVIRAIRDLKLHPVFFEEGLVQTIQEKSIKHTWNKAISILAFFGNSMVRFYQMAPYLE